MSAPIHINGSGAPTSSAHIGSTSPSHAASQLDDARLGLSLLDDAEPPAPMTAPEVQSFEGPEKLLEVRGQF